MSKLIITGAGVDRSEGINFPLANNLIGGIANFLNTDIGKSTDQILREMLPNLRFSFNSVINDAINNVASHELEHYRVMINNVQECIKKIDGNDIIHKHGVLLIKLFNKLASIAENSNIDDDIESLIKEVFPDKIDELIDENIIDINKLSISDTFKSILKLTLRKALENDDNPVATALGIEMLNIEVLLIKHFLGFYTHSESEIKKYIYISWVLWAYLVFKEQEVLNNTEKDQLPFYKDLPKDIRGITLNYTSFLANALQENIIHFHGSLYEYVRMDTRHLMPIENSNSFDIVNFLSEIIKPNINITHHSFSEHKHVIPSLVPPLRLKPILSNKYIELWSQASKWIKESKHIIVVGYSFNSADEHFNDILRNSYTENNAKIDIIVPEADSPHFLHRMEKVFGCAQSQFDTITLFNRKVLKNKNLRLIPSYATAIDISKLFNS